MIDRTDVLHALITNTLKDSDAEFDFNVGKVWIYNRKACMKVVWRGDEITVEMDSRFHWVHHDGCGIGNDYVKTFDPTDEGIEKLKQTIRMMR